MNTIKLSSLLLLASKNAVKVQRQNGSFPPGHNGPYFDKETPVRNTAHYLYLLSSLYDRYRKEEFKIAAEKALTYLFSEEARPHFKTYHHRDKLGKDRCNGLIGQAWCLEALIKASKVFKCEDSYRLAEEIYYFHPFDEAIGLWHRVEVDGRILSFDPTFNHQLWFAAASSGLIKTPDAQKHAQLFLNKIAKNIKLYKNGVIYHNTSQGESIKYLNKGIKCFKREMVNRIRNKRKLNDKELYAKSVGYHGFNLYGFGMLKSAFPECDIWEDNFIHPLLMACEIDSFQLELLNTKYGYHYNLSGLEIAYAYEAFGYENNIVSSWLQRQFDNSWKDVSEPLARNSSDLYTTHARLYVACRLNGDYSIEY